MQFFITGSSSGIGRALAEEALENGHSVTGISRRNTIHHPAYKHLNYDLARTESYLKMNFNINKEADTLVLINNAGWLGEVKPIGRLNPENIKRAMDINLLAPTILCNMFIEQTEGTGQKRIIVNITSGAAQYPVSGWSTYCASKAGINLLTEVMQKDHPDVKCMAIAPGVVDTAMQGEIRSLETYNFPDRERFVDYKEQGALSKPQEVAQKILKFVYNANEIPDVIFSLRDVS